MGDWFNPAVTAVANWLGYQVRQGGWPGLQIAVAKRGRKGVEAAFGVCSLLSGKRLMPDTRLRVASHSKTFTAVGIMRLVDTGQVRLDDPAGRFVTGLHKDTAETTIGQLLAHASGVTRDGADAGQWQMRRPFLDADELRQALAQQPVLTANTRFKYSNHGYGLLGLIVERVTGEPYAIWMAREIVARTGLSRTMPDGPVDPGLPTAKGHGIRSLLGERFEVDIGGSTGALAPATGFVSTAGDLAKFFSLLVPDADSAILTPASRREMTRRQWRVPDLSAELHYGFGLMHGGADDWAWFGHSGVFPGCLSHTSVVPAHGVAISVIVNSVDVQPMALVDGAIAILRAFQANGPAVGTTSGWAGRWWSPWTVFDLLPMGQRVYVTLPGQLNPLVDATELIDIAEGTARIGKASGFSSHGEAARLNFDKFGRPCELWLGGNMLLPEADMADEVRNRFLMSEGVPASSDRDDRMSTKPKRSTVSASRRPVHTKK